MIDVAFDYYIKNATYVIEAAYVIQAASTIKAASITKAASAVQYLRRMEPRFVSDDWLVIQRSRDRPHLRFRIPDFRNIPLVVYYQPAFYMDSQPQIL